MLRMGVGFDSQKYCSVGVLGECVFGCDFGG
jgi:hypothetical protein